MDFDKFEWFSNTYANFSVVVPVAPKYATQAFFNLRRDLNPSGVMMGDWFQDIKNPKLREMFTQIKKDESGKIRYDEWKIDTSHPIVQYWLQGEVLEKAYKENSLRVYQSLWDKWVKKLPVIFRLEEKTNFSLGVIKKDGEIYHRYNANAHRDYFDQEMYDLFLLLEENPNPSWLCPIDFSFDLTIGTFKLEDFIYTIQMRKDGTYILMKVECINLDNDYSGIYYDSVVNNAKEILSILNKAGN